MQIKMNWCDMCKNKDTPECEHREDKSCYVSSKK